MKYYNKEMENIHPEGCEAMTWEDAQAVEQLNQECGWGIGMSDALRMLADHIDAYDCEYRGIPRNEAKRTMEMIEWRLEDANFHTFMKALHDLDYDKALKLIVDEYTVGGGE